MTGWRSPLDQDSDYYEDQAKRAERFADRLSPRIGGKFRQLAEEWRRRARTSAGEPGEGIANHPSIKG